jgi:hypothetical protein
VHNKYGSYDKLILYIVDGEISITSYNKLYTEFKNAVTNDKPQVELKVKWSSIVGRVLLVIVFLVMFGSLIPYGVYTDYFDKVHYITAGRTVTIGGVLTNKPSPYDNTISIYLKEYPKFEFIATNEAFYGMHVGKLIMDTKPGDSVFVGIDKETYLKKIERTLPLTFADKHDDYFRIHLYSLRDTKNDYLTIDDHNHSLDLEMRSKKRGVWIYPIAVIFVLGVSYYTVKKDTIPLYKKYRSQNEE